MWNNTINMINSLTRSSNVVMRNQDSVIAKLSRIAADGKSKLQVIADFDWTLTKSNVNGNPTMHCYDIFALLPVFSDSYHHKKNEYLHKYVKLLNEAGNDDEKHNISKQWFQDHEKLIVGVKVTSEDLENAVRQANVPLRDGCVEYMEKLSDHGIPLTVLSSGIGDIIDIHLQQQGLAWSGTLANFLDVEHSVVRGFKDPFISTYNKDDISMPVLDDRTNIILLGDSVEDYKMSESIPNKDVVLKIAFCLDESKVPKFEEHFDVILVNDQTMNTVEALTSLLL